MSPDPNTQDVRSAPEPVRGAGSLRNRLVRTNIIIISLALVAVGSYSLYRSGQSGATLADQLETNVRDQAANNLLSASAEQVASLNEFFGNMRRDITDAGASAARMLSEEGGLNTGAYWDATVSVSRLPSGSWDNSNSDPASVFIPAQTELSEMLALQLNTLKHLDFVVPGKLQANPDAVAIYFGGPSGETLYYPNIDLANVVPSEFDVTQRPWYVSAVPAQDPEHQPVWSQPYLDAALHGLVVTTSVPVIDDRGAFRGVMAMDVQLGKIADIVSRIHAGQTGYAFLIDPENRLIALPEGGYADWGLRSDEAPLGERLDSADLAAALPEGLNFLLDRMATDQVGLDTVSIGGVERLVAYRPVPEVGYRMAILVPSEELLAGAIAAREQVTSANTTTAQFTLVLVAIIILLASLATAILGNSLTSPLASLTRTAEKVTAGDLDAVASVRSKDEIGILAQTLNTMTSNLKTLVQSLEQRVRERTSALASATEEANRRAAQFEAITRVTRAISSVRNVGELLPLVTSVISDAFSYYHVGIFLNDETSENTHLIAANSEGGRRMLARRHSLKIGEQGIVGYVAARGAPRVARNVGEDVVFFNNPDLPTTRSEAALPLRSAGRIIGVLDVQSTKADAFQPDDIRILGVLADQVSLAIENTRLLEGTQRSLAETETLYRQYVQDAWRRFRPEEDIAGYRFTSQGSAPLGKGSAVSSEDVRAGGQKLESPSVHVPLKIRGETIGDLVVEGAPAGGWNADQLDLIRAVGDRVALSVENARLFDETSRRAARERLVTEISSKIRGTNDPERMTQTALEELQSVLGASRVQIVPQKLPQSISDDNPPPPDV